MPIQITDVACTEEIPFYLIIMFLNGAAAVTTTGIGIADIVGNRRFQSSGVKLYCVFVL